MKNVYEKLISAGLISLLFFASNAAFADTGATMSDSAITAKVKAQLATDNVTHATRIKVITNNGVVSLSGNVSSDTEANRAVQIAESTKDVTDVNTDNLQVKNSSHPMTDSYITAKVKGAMTRESLVGNNKLPVTKIKVETQNGTVYLSGNVDNQQQVDTAINLAKSISGVNNVVSAIEINNQG